MESREWGKPESRGKKSEFLSVQHGSKSFLIVFIEEREWRRNNFRELMAELFLKPMEDLTMYITNK